MAKILTPYIFLNTCPWILIRFLPTFKIDLKFWGKRSGISLAKMLTPYIFLSTCPWILIRFLPTFCKSFKFDLKFWGKRSGIIIMAMILTPYIFLNTCPWILIRYLPTFCKSFKIDLKFWGKRSGISWLRFWPLTFSLDQTRNMANKCSDWLKILQVSCIRIVFEQDSSQKLQTWLKTNYISNKQTFYNLTQT